MSIRDPLAVFRVIAPEFADTEDDIVTVWLELTEPLVSQRQFKKLWTQALALLTAHRMKMAGLNEDDDLADIKNLDVGGVIRVANYSEGDTSIGFNTNTNQYTEGEAELGLTVYGIQYLRLRRMAIVTIRNSSEV